MVYCDSQDSGTTNSLSSIPSLVQLRTLKLLHQKHYYLFKAAITVLNTDTEVLMNVNGLIRFF